METITRPAEPVEKPIERAAPPLRPARPASLRRSRWLAIVLVLALLVPIGAVAHAAWQSAALHESTDDAFIDGDIVPISSRVSGNIEHLYVTDNQVVHKGDLLLTLDPADFEARVAQAEAQLQQARQQLAAARIKVHVTNVTSYAGIGSASAQVSQAQSTVTQAQQGVVTARAQVDTAKARVDQAAAEVLAAQHNQEQAEAQVAATQADELRARQDLARGRELLSQNAISRQDLDHAVAQHQAAQAQVEAAQKRVAALSSSVADARAAVVTSQEQLRGSQSQVGEAESRVTQAQATVSDARNRLTSSAVAPQQVALTEADVMAATASVKAAEANLRTARLNLQYTRIYAPSDGRVTRRNAQAGANVQPTQVLFSLVDPAVWVTANFKETQLARMHVGQPVVIHVDAYPQLALHGHIDSLQQGSGARFSLLPPENATGNYVKVVQRVPIKIAIDDKPQGVDLGPGMSVVPEVSLK